MPLGGSEPTSGSLTPETTSWVSGLGPGDGSAGADMERQWTGCRVRGSVSHLVGQSRAVVERRRPHGGQARCDPDTRTGAAPGEPHLSSGPTDAGGARAPAGEPRVTRHLPVTTRALPGRTLLWPLPHAWGLREERALPGASEMLATRPQAEQTPVLLTTPASWSYLF